jgi:hypothetical protein
LTFAAWRLLESEADQFGVPGLQVKPVTEFLQQTEQHRTSVGDRQVIAQQAIVMFDHLYPHMPFKAEIYGLEHPSAYLRREVLPPLAELSEIDFQTRMIEAFSLVRDAHTLYGLPAPYRAAVAFLPFQLRPYLDPEHGWRFVVTSVMPSQPDGGFGHPYFGTGAEIIRWSGIQALEQVQRTEQDLPGGNYFAGLARGCLHSTMRPLMYIRMPFPDELPAVTLHYRPEGSGDVRAIRIPWGVGIGFGAGVGFPSAAFSLSPATAVTRSFSKLLHHRTDLRTDKAAGPASTIPEAFDFQYTGGDRPKGYIDLADLVDLQRPDARFGYIRIKAFSDGSSAPGSTERLVQEFRRIVTLMDQKAPDGLVIDIRSNPGGDVEAAECMLQMLTPEVVEPALFHLANTPAVQDLLLALKAPQPKGLSAQDSVRFHQALAEFEPWLDGAGDGPLTAGHPLTDSEDANDIGQIYHGRGIVLLINSLTYSAADIFAAGFQDHRAGLILGTSMLTGGGGASVWRHEDLIHKIGPRPALPLAPLPGDATMTLAIRRCSRVRAMAGQPVEDVAVEAEFYTPDSVADVILGNPGILRRACEALRDATEYRIDVISAVLSPNGAVVLQLRTRNIASLKFYVNGRFALEGPAAERYTVPSVTGFTSRLRIEGYGDDSQLRRARTLPFEPPLIEQPEGDA